MGLGGASGPLSRGAQRRRGPAWGLALANGRIPGAAGAGAALPATGRTWDRPLLRTPPKKYNQRDHHEGKADKVRDNDPWAPRH